ncbi:MAG: ribonuclease P protein component [Candidatus Peribacteria bacterium]|nr:ribonuclease P protein component [Candidatus Peribacteria bacterium]
MVSDILKNNYNHNRFAIVLSAKSVKSSVERNFFRRRFYDFVGSSLLLDKENGYDVVFVVKQKTKLDQKSEECLKDFYKDLDFLIKNI